MEMIFIGGTGRSGTTILAHILGKCDSVFVFPTELRLITDPDGLINLKYSLVDEWSFFQGDFAVERFIRLLKNLQYRFLNTYPNSNFNKLVGSKFYKDWLKLIENEFSYLCETNIWAARANVFNKLLFLSFRRKWFLELLYPSSYYTIPLDEENFFLKSRKILNTFFEQILVKKNKSIIVDHTPSNIIHAKFLVNLFPDIKLINIIRDPKDVVASFKSKDWGAVSLETNIKLIKNIISQTNNKNQEIADRNLVNIHFENLVYMNEKTINKLSTFLELDFNKLIAQVDLSKHNIGNWQKILNKEEQKLVLREFPDYSYEK